MKLIAGLGAAAAAALIAAPTAHADTNSYLDYLHSHHAGAIAGFSDFALIIGGNKACVLPPDQVAAVAPGMPAVSSAVYDAAHRELC